MKYPICILKLLTLLTIVTFVYSFDNNNSKLSTVLSRRINYQNDNEKNLVWIYFIDKGPDTIGKFSSPNKFLTKKSIQRRQKRIGSDKLFDENDLPVNASYINELTYEGIEIKHKSKWLNAVSCYANKIQIENILLKYFVKKIESVGKFKNANEESGNPEINFLIQNDNTTSINYGLSLVQSNIINLPPAHELGYSGEGILIASFDAGFDNLQHRCFDLMRSKGLRTWDFVNGDTIVADGEGRMGVGAHGTLTLSLAGGFDDGFLVSPAFNSKFILAKTENTDSETPLEEDNWVAAAEWADSLGADIITCSLGYVNFDPPYQSYTWEDMDGNTTVITVAANIAVSKGIVVVISSGNSGYNFSHNTLNAPADGFDVITVGAVKSNRERANYSSVGPTVDGRIKPDVMAMGSNNYTARSGAGNTGYVNIASGTSLSCPMVAGVCALILSANPNLTPVEVRDILRTTADSNASPGNLYGWGIVNAYSAIQLALNANPNPEIPSGYSLQQNYPNPFNPSTTISYQLPKSGIVKLFVYDIDGKEIAALVNEFKQAGRNEINFSGSNLSSGIYFYKLETNNFIQTKKMLLVK